MEPDSDGYTEKELARSATVSWLDTHTAMGRMSSDAVGATTTPPMIMPEFLRQNSFTKPRRSERILARGLPARGNTSTRAETSPASICAWETPTVAISGRVNTAEDTVRRRIGDTPSPRA